jgi:alkanesulfonate monooxygenase SsuD/methylene tetrahydromethanopterin reductase-like flavin-dependent oxidoreductase (luciferase family)
MGDGERANGGTRPPAAHAPAAESPGLEFLLRFDMRAPDFGLPQERLYAAALELAEYADALGFHTISFPEHHGTHDGYSPRPFLLASAIAARTRGVRLRLSAVVLPLHDPIAVAEQIAVLDQLSAGRVEVVLGLGYVRDEYEMFGVAWRGRVARFETAAHALTHALEHGEFSYQGRTGRISPLPLQQPRPPVYIGGAVPAAARRAARLGDGFITVIPTPELRSVYAEECARLGRGPGPVRGYGAPPSAVFVSEDPDRTWDQILRHVVHDQQAYGAIVDQGFEGDNPYRSSDQAVREGGAFAVLTPGEAVDFAQARHREGLAFPIVPLVGGLAPDVGRESMRLVADRVVPTLRNRGVPVF